MHHASGLILPASAAPWPRPDSPPRGTLHLAPGDVGVASRAAYLAAGGTDSELRAAVRQGALRRIAFGWYAEESAQPKVSRPIREGYRLTCISATRMHGVWTPYGDSSPDHDEDDPHRLHVYCDRSAKAAPRGMSARHARTGRWQEPDPIASLPLALHHAMRCQSGETAAILLESAIERRLLTPNEVQLMMDDASAAVSSRIGSLSTASDSGSETRVVRWLRRRSFHVDQQPFVDGVGYLDVYAGGLFLEIDGRAPHDTPDAFNRDRRRDLMTSSHGLQVLRVSYDQVWSSWEDTQKLILSAITAVGPFGRKKVAELLAR